MATKSATADYLVEQLSGAGAIAAKKMFGEYGVYRGGVLFALICDDELYVKDTPGGRALVGTVQLKPPYPGAKPHLWIRGDRCEDADWLTELAKATVREMPAKAKPAAKARSAAAPKAAVKRKSTAKPKPAAKPKAPPSVRSRPR